MKNKLTKINTVLYEKLGLNIYYTELRVSAVD